MSKEIKDIETIIGSTVQVEGDFKAQGDVIIEGKLNGKLKTKGNLNVGDRAEIQAEIEALNAIIAGKIIGNIKIKEGVEIMSTAQIEGNIETQIISVATGAKINGQIIMSSDIKKDGTEQFLNK